MFKLSRFRFLWQWGWVIAFMFVTLIATERALKRVRDEKAFLSATLTTLKEDQAKALVLQKRLNDQINSQSDPAWIELVLKRELGLSPEGQIKILFTN